MNKSELSKEEIAKVLFKLIGVTTPKGESNYDNEVVKPNVEKLIHVYEHIDNELRVLQSFETSHEHSVRVVGEMASEARRTNPALLVSVIEWVKKGEAILDEKYHDFWGQVVPTRLNDLYHGKELRYVLEIVERLNAGCEMDEAKSIMDAQPHSGASFNLVCNMVRQFCDRGKEFASYVSSATPVS